MSNLNKYMAVNVMGWEWAGSGYWKWKDDDGLGHLEKEKGWNPLESHDDAFRVVEAIPEKHKPDFVWALHEILWPIFCEAPQTPAWLMTWMEIAATPEQKMRAVYQALAGEEWSDE